MTQDLDQNQKNEGSKQDVEKFNNITPFEVDPSKWYSDLLIQAELISYGPVKGTLFYQPYSFEIWKNIQSMLSLDFKVRGVQDVYFPLLLPEKLLQQEAKHVEGFAPEALLITRVGNEPLNENLVIRPTSEMLFNIFFKEKLKSYKQLPYKLNQWVNVIRWEKNTRPFLRTSEFLWQEGHTCHNDAIEAKAFSKEMINVYENFVREKLLLPVFKGEKTVKERFAGAENTYTIETILKDGQALQSGTSHFLGQTFTNALNVNVLNSNNEMVKPFQTSWGVSTRLIGAVLMTHSDNKGLVLPTFIAPYEIVVVTIDYETNKLVKEVVDELVQRLELNGFKVFVDKSDKGFGHKMIDAEVKGIPARVELGPKDIENNNIIFSTRISGKKTKMKFDDFTVGFVEDLLKKYNEELYKRAQIRLEENEAKNVLRFEDLGKLVKDKKYIFTYWNLDDEKENEIKEKWGLTIRCVVNQSERGKCLHSGNESKTKVLIARAY